MAEDFLGHSVELFNSERLKQIVKSIYLVTLSGIFRIGCNKHDHRRILQCTYELKTVYIRHIDVYEDQIDFAGLQCTPGRLDIMTRGDKFQKRIFEYIAFQLVKSQRLVIDNYASYVHIPGITSVTE